MERFKLEIKLDLNGGGGGLNFTKIKLRMEHSLLQNFFITKHQEERKSRIILRVEHFIFKNFV